MSDKPCADCEAGSCELHLDWSKEPLEHMLRYAVDAVIGALGPCPTSKIKTTYVWREIRINPREFVSGVQALIQDMKIHKVNRFYPLPIVWPYRIEMQLRQTREGVSLRIEELRNYGKDNQRYINIDYLGWHEDDVV